MSLARRCLPSIPHGDVIKFEAEVKTNRGNQPKPRCDMGGQPKMHLTSHLFGFFFLFFFFLKRTRLVEVTLAVIMIAVVDKTLVVALTVSSRVTMPFESEYFKLPSAIVEDKNVERIVQD